MKVIISDDASADLEDIGDFIAQDNPDAAISFVRRLRSRCSDLSQFPDSGRKREEFRRGLRSVTEGDYVIFYRTLDADVLVIMRIIHGKRDLRKLSFSDT